ncbi:MAG: DUF4007 family protein [Desulfobacterium sp.]|nr:DUF4007 family protein [Desulfobacterium sp.]
MKERLDKYSKGSAGRHETFVPRYGWLTKGYVKCIEDSGVFTGTDNIVALGVGKNMVRSIRFWCLFLGLLKVAEKGQLYSTELGKRLIGPWDDEKKRMNWDLGWDPYLEDDASLWLLHWQIFTHPEMAVSWPLVFNFSSLQTFTQQELGAGIIKIAADDARLGNISQNSYNKDAACIIHMYRPSASTETEIHCPFNALGLIEKTQEKGHFRFSLKERHNLPPLIFLASCFSFANMSGLSGKTMNLNTIAYGNDSPGTAFKLSETECGRLLDQAVGTFDSLHFVESAGTWQLHFTGEPQNLYWECLEKYYKE